MQIEPYEPRHLDAVIRLSLRAWTPVFDSIQKVMNADVYRAFYPDHWRVSQQEAVEGVCVAEDTNVWVCDQCRFYCGLCSRETTLPEQHG